MIDSNETVNMPTPHTEKTPGEIAAAAQPAPSSPAPDDAAGITVDAAAKAAALALHHGPNIKPKSEIFDESLTFNDLGLRSSVLKGVEASGFTKPTAIQAKLIPLALTGRDILGQAKTGTGKTAAFGLPIVHMCHKDVQFQALILAPTRELAIQITDEINELAKFTPIRAVTIYGGQAIQAQAKKVQSAAQILVGTPGRIMDMRERGIIHFNNLRFAVLDEVDRMFDIGFREDIRKILELCPPPGNPGQPGCRQTIFVSATISAEIEKLARRHMVDPEKVITSAGSLTVSLVEQYHIPVNQWDKRKLLLHLLTHEEPALTIVFCRLKRSCDDLVTYLHKHNIEAHAIHGDMSQGKRTTTMQKLRAGSLSVLIASDLASRGIDADGVSHVINYDLPDDPDLYVHRIGRTARAGRGGIAWSLVTPEQGELLTQIEMLVNAEIPKLHYPNFTPSPQPEGWRGEGRGGRPEGGLRPVVAGGGITPPEPAAPKLNRIEAAANLQVPVADAGKVDTSKFPGGLVPTKMPPKRINGRIPGGRR